MYEEIIEKIGGIVNSLNNSIPTKYQTLLGLFLYVLFIVLYSFFIWKFYKFLAKKNIIELNLRQYNKSKNAGFEKLFVTVLDIVEYIIILPFIVLFWFTVFSIFLIILSESTSTVQILMITAAIIASTRITSYISEDLSKDIAKIFPFTVLAMFLLNPDFFGISGLFDKISQIPSVFEHILIFIVFIFGVELILRIFYILVELIYSKEEVQDKSEKSGQ